jgi:uncharacterized protein (TIGR00725 family)
MIQIAIAGGKECDAKTYAIAEEVGRCVARERAVLICGGLGGVMEAAAKGAKDIGGLTIGILPGRNKNEANQYIDIVVATGVGFARNLATACSCDGMIAIDGKFGTLTEIAYALDASKPVAMINTWHLEHPILASTLTQSFDTPQAAIAWLLSHIESS